MHDIKWFVFLTVAAQYNEGPTYSVLVVHPAGQDVELSYGGCVRQRSANESAAWMIGQRGPCTVNSLANGLLDGYSANLFTYNLIIKNIMKDDDRNGIAYRCVISITISSSYDNRGSPGYEQAIEKGNVTILYIAGEYC